MVSERKLCANINTAIFARCTRSSLQRVDGVSFVTLSSLGCALEVFFFVGGVETNACFHFHACLPPWVLWGGRELLHPLRKTGVAHVFPVGRPLSWRDRPLLCFLALGKLMQRANCFTQSSCFEFYRFMCTVDRENNGGKVPLIVG